ncbi:MAG TPA: hypothetical protein VFN91_12055 [Myxococcaceae bacterium]|nr:hypothetical protein [Myxococcaceae bacterium]
MKLHLPLTAALLVASSAGATDVGVSVSVGDSGFYGRIDVGTMPKPPPVVYSQPVVVQTAPVVVERPPIYLRVPPGHAKHWKKHCREYNACGERVYFVQEGWYNEHYAASREGRRVEPVEYHEHGHDKDHGDHDHDRGHGHGHGNEQ